MTTPENLGFSLRNTPIRELIRALERDGFLPRRSRGSHRVYRHDDGRRVVLNFHRSSDTLPRGTLAQVLGDAQWTSEDARRLGLSSQETIQTPAFALQVSHTTSRVTTITRRPIGAAPGSLWPSCHISPTGTGFRQPSRGPLHHPPARRRPCASPPGLPDSKVRN